MRLGVLDVGSNTVHMLVVDAYPGARPLPAFSHKVPLSLAAHLEKGGTLSKSGEEQLTDVVFIELPDVGDHVFAGESFGEIESVKAVSDLYSPVDGEVIAINEAMPAKPEILNDSANETWIIKVTVMGTMTGKTLTAGEYEHIISEESVA